MNVSDLETIRLGHSLDTVRPTLHNGPGWRIGIWTQGCVHRCTDQCLSPHLLDPAGGREFPVSDVIDCIVKVAAGRGNLVEGITVLGGEPTEQAAAVARLATAIRNVGLSVMIYTGHTLEWLTATNDPEIRKLLTVTDVLVDGPYLPNFYRNDIAWRGSSNQRLLCLSDRYNSEQLSLAFQEQGKGYSIFVGKGRISFSGLQSRAAAEALEQQLKTEPNL